MIYLALRYLSERKRQTLLTVMGVFFGTVAYVVVSGFFLGFQGFMVQQLVDNSAQIHIQARQDYLMEHDLDEAFYGKDVSHIFWRSPPARVVGYQEVQDPQSWYERLQADPRVEAFAPVITVPALFSLSQVNVSATLNGCHPEQLAKVTSVAAFMTEGSFNDIGAGGNRIIVGSELAKRLGTAMNEAIWVSVGAGQAAPFKVVGTFSTGNRNVDLAAYASLADVQKVNRTPNRVNEIQVRMKDYKMAGAVATSWTKVAPELSQSWDQLFANVLSVFAIQTTLRFTMIFTVLIVAGFGIYNILNMTVNQKRQDIAILRSMGYDSFDVVVLFFSQGLIVGVIGSTAGLFVGYLLCRYLQTIQFFAGMPNNPTGHLHISLSIWIYLQAVTMSLFAVSLASILPARAASKLTPIDVIRAGG
jgi:lipoprotein-releasing system permease protein